MLYSQCSNELYPEKLWKPLLDDFTPIKTYRIDGKGGDRLSIEYTAVISKDVLYRLVLTSKDGAAKGIVASIYDSKRKLVTSNTVDGKQQQITTFTHSATGLHYIVFTFKDSKSYCGFAKLGFKRVEE